MNGVCNKLQVGKNRRKYIIKWTQTAKTRKAVILKDKKMVLRRRGRGKA